MPTVDHPKVKRDRIIVRLKLPDPTIKHVLLVEAQMPLIKTDPGFNQAEYDALVQAVVAAMQENDSIDSAEIIPA